jgi:hypothetical protein
MWQKSDQSMSRAIFQADAHRHLGIAHPAKTIPRRSLAHEPVSLAFLDHAGRAEYRPKELSRQRSYLWVVRKGVAVREPAACIAGGTPALHCAFTGKTGKHGRLARIASRAYLPGLRTDGLITILSIRETLITQQSVIWYT